MNIDFLRALEIFTAVAEMRSMTAAARSLGITQSGVSQQLHQLEADLGRTLVDRSVRPLALTAAGTALQVKASQFLNHAAEVRSLVRETGSTVMPNLRIAVIGSLAGTLVPPLVSALTRQINIERISVSRGPVTTRENVLLNRDADMLITSDPLYDVDGLDRFPLFREPFILALPRRKGAPWNEKMSFAALAAAGSYIRYPRRTQMGWAIETQLNRMRVAIDSKLEFDSPDDIMALVAAGLGWTVTSPSHVLQGIRNGEAIRTAPFPGPAFTRTVSLIVRSNELGSVPRDVHGICTKVIAEAFLPEIRKSVSWIEDRFEILDADGQNTARAKDKIN